MKAPEEPVALDILAGEHRIGRELANMHRADLRAASLGSGHHGFAFRLPPDLTGAISVRGSDGHVPLSHAAWWEAAPQKARA